MHQFIVENRAIRLAVDFTVWYGRERGDPTAAVTVIVL